MAIDMYQTVTDSIIAALEKGAAKWERPWHVKAGQHAMPYNIASRKMYRGVNTLQLFSVAMLKGYHSNAWGTYKQWEAKGGQVRKGEKSTMAVLWKPFEKKERDASGKEVIKKLLYAAAFPVFNECQVDGYEQATESAQTEIERDAKAEEFFAGLGADIRHGGGQAYYSPMNDFVQMPNIADFKTMGGYYGTLSHEITHWTGHKARCDRTFGKSWGDDTYAAEELVAELGAAFVCAMLGLESVEKTDENHVGYIAHWLKVMKEDKKAIFSAASLAQKAVDWMIAKNAPEVAETEEMAEAA